MNTDQTATNRAVCLCPYCLQNKLIKYSKDEVADGNCYKWREKGYNIDMCNKGGAVYFIFAVNFIISEPFFSHTPDRDFGCLYPCEIMLSHIPTPARGEDKNP